MALFQQGRLPQAEAAARRAVAVDPNHADGRCLLGVILAIGRNWAEADGHLSFVVAHQPNRPEALYWSSVAKKNLGQLAEAITLVERAAALNPRNSLVLNELGLCLMAANQPKPAEEAFRKAVRSSPTEGVYIANLGMAQARLDLIYKAKDSFEEAVRLAAELVQPYVELAAIYDTLAERQLAIEVLTKAVKHHPVDFQLHSLLAHAYANAGDRERAEELYRRTVEADPASGQAYGLWLQQEGRFEESIGCFLKSIQADPNQGVAYYGLAEAKAFDLEAGSLVELATPILDSPSLDVKARAYLGFALGRAHEQRREYEKSMGFYDLANDCAYRVYNEGRPYDRNEIARVNDLSISRFSPLAKRTPVKDAFDPIFIVGMIRSGTTLLDQIVSSHPNVASAGEPVFWQQEADRTRRLSVMELASLDAAAVASRYEAVLQGAAGSSPRITDKMPLNYAHLGLIHAVFPKAKIVHLRRSPMDTCLSIYTTFLGHGPNFAYRQANIVFNYLEYMRLMDHWRSILPTDVLMEIDYESIVRDREAAARDVIAFCGLDWDDACLRHESNETSIRTPSRWQARQPVYGSSIERWRNFEPWLGDLLQLKALQHPPIESLRL
jgi:tetratricopeptide (TPR) repeat protein